METDAAWFFLTAAHTQAHNAWRRIGFQHREKSVRNPEMSWGWERIHRFFLLISILKDSKPEQFLLTCTDLSTYGWFENTRLHWLIGRKYKWECLLHSKMRRHQASVSSFTQHFSHFTQTFIVQRFCRRCSCNLLLLLRHSRVHKSARIRRLPQRSSTLQGCPEPCRVFCPTRETSAHLHSAGLPPLRTGWRET